MGKWVHRLSDVDAETKEANCENCGRVRIVYQSDKGRWKCWIGRQEQRGKGRHGLNGKQRREATIGASCEICGRVDRLVIDHSHETGLIRGVLCHWCNVAIGMMQDDPSRLRLAATYLEK